MVEQRGCEVCHEHAQRATHDTNIKQRDTNDVVDVLGGPAVGVVSAKQCMQGAQRGIHKNLKPILLEFSRTGMKPLEILTTLQISWQNGELRDVIQGRAALPSARQITVRLQCDSPGLTLFLLATRLT